MAWTDRIKEGAYTSAESRTRLTFDFEDVSLEINKKTSSFEFPDANGTQVQDRGVSGRRFPVRAIFWGADHDTEAAAFLNALSETGTGRLEHPFYGTFDVVPFGKITRRDDLKTAANQSIIEVTFFNTIGTAYPTGQTDASGEVVTAISDFNDTAATEYENEIEIDTASQRVSLRSQYSDLIGDIEDGLSDIADTQDDVQSQFDSVVDSINQSIDVLIADPLSLASQTLIAIQSPARAITSIQARLDAYSALANSLIADEPDDENTYRTNNLVASGYVTGQVVSVVNTQFTTKTDAITAAETVLDQLDAVTTWSDTALTALEVVDTGGAYQQLQSAVALCAGYLIEISFTLKQERSVFLDRDRTIIDLAAELYGSVDDKLDFLISTNNLSGDEHIEIKRGREIVYYV